MILTDYYLLKELRRIKSHRLDCVASTGEYGPFEAIRARSKDGRFFCYYNGVPDTFSADAQRKAGMAITNGDNISSVFVPDMEHPSKAYGDVKGTNDGLLFLMDEDCSQMEVFVARGYKHCIKELFFLFVDGELDGELDVLRAMAASTMDGEQ